MEGEPSDGVCWRISEKMWTKYGQELLLSGLKRKYARGKLAVAAIISLEQKKVLAWYLEKPLKNTPYNSTS